MDWLNKEDEIYIGSAAQTWSNTINIPEPPEKATLAIREATNKGISNLPLREWITAKEIYFSKIKNQNEWCFDDLLIIMLLVGNSIDGLLTREDKTPESGNTPSGDKLILKYTGIMGDDVIDFYLKDFIPKYNNIPGHRNKIKDYRLNEVSFTKIKKHLKMGQNIWRSIINKQQDDLNSPIEVRVKALKEFNEVF